MVEILIFDFLVRATLQNTETFYRIELSFVSSRAIVTEAEGDRDELRIIFGILCYMKALANLISQFYSVT